MAASINLRIITPERVVLERAVEQVSAKAIDGELTILPNHEPLTTALDFDILRFKVDGGEETAAIMGGVMEVTDNMVTVVSDMAELDTEIDEARAHQARQRAEAEKIQKTDKLTEQLAEMALSRAMARLKAIEMVKRRRRGSREI